MKKTICVMAGLLLNFVLYSTALAQNYYVDNINGDDSNDGTSWTSAFKTLRYLAPNSDYTKWVSLQAPENQFFIRATDTPYRIVDNTVLIAGIGHYYFDATGIDEQRGTARARLYGSQQISAGNWVSLSPESSPAKLYRADSPYVDHEITRVYVDGATPQLLSRTYDLLNIADLQYYVDTQNRIYFRSDSAHPGEMDLEWIADHNDMQGIEGFYNMWIHGVELKYFTKGYSQGGCNTLEVSDMEVSYIAQNGVVFDSALPEGAKFQNVVSHHNGGNGIVFKAHSNTLLANCVSHHNQGSGIQLLSGGTENSTATVVHCTSFNNQGAGFEIATLHSATGNTTQWNIMNNISSSNSAGEFVLLDDANAPFALFNGWFGQNNALFSQNAGFSNLDNVDPLFIDASSGDYHLSSNSPYIGQGVHTVIFQDIDNQVRDTYAPDLGADEYY